MKCIYIFIFILFFLSSEGQNQSSFKVSESAVYKDAIKTTNVAALFVAEDDKTIVARFAKKGLLIDFFDKKLNKIESELIERDNKEVFKGIFLVRNSLNICSYVREGSGRVAVYRYAMDLDQEKKVIKTKLLEEEFKKKDAIRSVYNSNNIVYSENGKFYVLSTIETQKKSFTQRLRVFDAFTNKQIYKQEFTQDENRKYTYKDIYIDNEGSVYVLGKLKIKNSEETLDHFVLNKISKNEINESMVDLKDHFIRSLNIEAVNSKLLLVGYYSEKNGGGLKGTCIFSIDRSDNQVVDTRSYPLSKGIYDDLYSEKKASKKHKKNKALSFFRVNHVLLDSKDNVYIVSEQFHTSVASDRNGNLTTYYHYDNILITKINVSGKLVWENAILKKSHRPMYNAFLKEDKLHVMLNSKKNLEPRKDGRLKISYDKGVSSSLYDLEYQEDGELKVNVVRDNKGNNEYNPYRGYYNNGRFVVMSSNKSKKKSFLMLE